MLKLRFGDFTDDCIVQVNGYFNSAKKKEWFNRPEVKKIIKDIDNSDAIKDEYIESPVFGGMSPQSLSGGCKAVILMEVLEHPHIYGTKCGDNCVPSILEIASRKNVILTLHHTMVFPEEFEAYLIEYDKVIHSRKEFIDEFYDFRHNRRKYELGNTN
jgi:hypothetical protein